MGSAGVFDGLTKKFDAPHFQARDAGYAASVVYAKSVMKQGSLQELPACSSGLRNHTSRSGPDLRVRERFRLGVDAVCV